LGMSRVPNVLWLPEGVPSGTKSVHQYILMNSGADSEDYGKQPCQVDKKLPIWHTA